VKLSQQATKSRDLSYTSFVLHPPSFVMFDKTYVIGTGGTGGYMIPPLVRLLQYHKATRDNVVTIFDGDVFEDKNQSRQMMTPDYVGQNKALAMAEMCQNMGLTNVNYVDEFITMASFVPYLEESEAPLIIAAVDNDATRAAIIDAIDLTCSEKDFFFITPGNSDGEEEVRGQTLWFGRINGETVGINPKSYPNISNPDDEIPRAGSCARMQQSRPQLITANFMAAASTLAVLQNLLDEKLESNRSAIFFNIRNLKTSVS
jgi:hypothetical protein